MSSRIDISRVARLMVAATIASIALAGVLMAPSRAAAATPQRGVADNFIVNWPVDEQDAAMAELGTQLKAEVFRLDLFWHRAEPSRGVYDDAGYLAGITRLVDAARAQGLRVVVTVYETPPWASDTSLWSDPPATYKAGEYRPFYPIAPAALPDFERFAGHLATLLRGKVYAYECWNEPNLWAFFYPQTAPGDPYFAIKRYDQYLEHFWRGIKAGDGDALVVAGATCPGGSSDKYRTAPQRFAKVLKNLGAAEHFDAYSHHPYTLGGNDPDPAAVPNNLHTVSMANISTLLDVFPDKPFFLTEYGYNTEFTYSFGTTVTEADQARYLRKAYAMAAKHPQIEMLLWYLVRDWSPKHDRYDPSGLYMGLRRLDGAHKRAWFAFAGGNHLTLTGKTRRPRGATLRLRGALTSDVLGGLGGRQLLLQRRRAHNPWRTIGTITTGDGGAFATSVVLRRTARFRVVWKGVVASPPHVVRAY